MELNDDTASSHRVADAASTAAAVSRLDLIIPMENHERIDDDKATEVMAAAASVTVDDGDAAAFVEMTATPAEAEQTRSSAAAGGEEEEEDDDDDNKTTETEAVTMAVADEEATGFAFPFGEPVPNQSSLLPLPGQRRTGPVITLCVNLHEMREARSLYSAYIDGKWHYHGDRTAVTASTVTTTTTTVTAPVAVSEGASTSTTSAVSPIPRFQSSSKPVITPLRQYDAPDIPILPRFTLSTNYDFTIYENRLKTFRNNWVLTFLTPRQMAKAGFFFLGKQDAVRCVFCSKEFDYWFQDVDPFERHKSESPDCQYLNQGLIYDICGNFESLPGHVPGNEVNMIHHFLKSVGIVHQVKVLTHNKILTSYESRYRTFNDSQTKINSDIDTLCKAGYYSTGISDETICFCCNQGLKEWETHDDPWVEHARWSPTCSFVLLSKGKHFVEEVGGEVNHNLNVDMEELCKLITIHKNTSIQNNNSASSSTERRLPYSNKTESKIVKQMVPDFSQYIIQQHPNTLPDSMLCKICYKEKLEVLFMPCGHIISCIQCAVTIEHCAVCRLPFTISLRVYIYPIDRTIPFYNEVYYKESVNKYVEAVPCKVCRKEDIELVFLPCRHACACFSCGKKMEECPVCFEKVYAFIKVFL